VSWYSDVFDIVFKDLDHNAARIVWKEQLEKLTTSSNSQRGGHEIEEE
jgi:hypothetical protein